MKRLFCIILCVTLVLVVLGLCTLLTGCSDDTPATKQYYEDTSLKLVDEIVDAYDNILQQTYYNQETGEYILKVFTYSYQDERWVCIDQNITILNAKVEDKIQDNTLQIYYNKNIPITIMDNEYATISIVEYLPADNWWEFGYKLKIVNKTNKILTILIDKLYIMNILCEPLFDVDYIDAGKTAYFTMAWDPETLERCYIPYIDNVEFRLCLYDNTNWNKPALAGTRVMFKK